MKKVVIVEGEIDKLALEVGRTKKCGIRSRWCAIHLTRKAFDTKFEYLENCEDILKDVKKIIIAVDNDEPGKKSLNLN